MYGGTSIYNGIQSKKSREASKSLQEDAQAHEELMQQGQMDYNSFPSQVSMMKEAGINPALMYGMSGSLHSVSAGSTGSGALASSPQAIPMQQPNENMIQAAMSIMSQKSNIAQAEAITQKTLAELPYIDAQTKESLKRQGLLAMQTKGQGLENALKFSDLQYRDIQNQLDVIAKKYGIAKTSAEAKKYLSSAELDQMQSRYTQVQINQAAFEYDKNRDIWNNCRDLIIDGIKAENSGKISEAQRLYAEAAIAMDRSNVITDTHIDPNSKFGILGVMSHILGKAVDHRVSNIKDLPNKFLDIWDNKVLPQVKSISAARKSISSDKKIFRTPSELWNDDVIQGNGR